MTMPEQVHARSTLPSSGASSPVSSFEQCRLAGAIRADDTDPVAALDAQGEVADDRAVAEILEDLLRVDDGLEPDIVLGDSEFGGAGPPIIAARWARMS